jgi:hypothetical protein
VLTSTTNDPREVELAEQIQVLRDENAALTSALCGLCIGLSQISEVHRAIVAQAFDYADRFVASGEIGGTEDVHGTQTRPQVIHQIRRLVMSRQSEVGLRY